MIGCAVVVVDGAGKRFYYDYEFMGLTWACKAVKLINIIMSLDDVGMCTEAVSH